MLECSSIDPQHGPDSSGAVTTDGDHRFEEPHAVHPVVISDGQSMLISFFAVIRLAALALLHHLEHQGFPVRVG